MASRFKKLLSFEDVAQELGCDLETVRALVVEQQELPAVHVTEVGYREPYGTDLLGVESSGRAFELFSPRKGEPRGYVRVERQALDMFMQEHGGKEPAPSEDALQLLEQERAHLAAEVQRLKAGYADALAELEILKAERQSQPSSASPDGERRSGEDRRSGDDRRTRNSAGGRTDPLRAVLDLARNRAAAPGDWPSEWAALVALAQQPDRPAPLLGYTDGEGVKWQAFDDDGEPVRHLTRDAFRKRVTRPRT